MFADFNGFLSSYFLSKGTLFTSALILIIIPSVLYFNRKSDSHYRKMAIAFIIFGLLIYSSNTAYYLFKIYVTESYSETYFMDLSVSLRLRGAMIVVILHLLIIGLYLALIEIGKLFVFYRQNK